MLVSSLHQRVEKRNSHKSRPVSFKLIVNPKLMPQKPRNKDHSSLFHKLPQKRLIALIISLTLVAVLVSLCFPIFPQNRELKEFDFPEQDKTMVSLLQDELSSYYTQPEPEQIMSPPLKNLKTIVYKVKKGDSLSGIAQKYKLNIGTIIGFNNIRNARSLVIGTTLTIPNYNGLLYTVKQGDSLSLISKKYDVSLNNLLDWNHLDTSVLTKGQQLFLPGATLSAKELNGILGHLFIYPTRGRLTSGFGWRNSPFTGRRELHRGLDLANVPGTSVFASRAGKVSKIGYDHIYGNFIIISHGDGFHTLYGHLKRILVSKGKIVAQGQRIGFMGATGLVTGPHLHFSIFKNGKAINPLTYLK